MSVTLIYKRNGVIVGQHVMDLVPVEGQHGHGKLHLPTIRRAFGLDIVELDGSVPVEIDGVTLRAFHSGTRVEVTGTPMLTARMISAYTLLTQSYRPIRLIGTSDSSTLAAGALLPRAIYTWTVPAEQLQGELQHAAHLHDVHVLTPCFFDCERAHQVEESCRDVFVNRVLDIVNWVLKAEGQSVFYIKPGTEIESGGAPDFSADLMVAGNFSGTLVVGEAKTPLVLEGVTDDLVGTQHVGKLRETIAQVWGYVMASVDNPEAGFFGTTNRVWFFRADRASQAMYVTDAVHCHAESPSVRQMMYLMLRLKGKPLPTDAVRWLEAEYHRILVDNIRQDSQQGQQQGGADQQGGRQDPVPRSQARTGGADDQQAAAASTSHNIIPFEDFQDRVAIGGGETGTVFAAWLHGRRVAVKTGDCYNRKDVVCRMMNEVATYKALQHLQGDVIPRLEEHGYTMWGGAYFVATQLISGRTHEEGREALAGIHASGYLHGDVRGDNFIVEEGTGKVLFLDLGHSRACSCDADFNFELRELQESLL